MDKINDFLDRFNRLIRTTGFQLTLFLIIQLVGLALAVASVHYMQTREQQFADMRLRYQGSVLRENVLDKFDVIAADTKYFDQLCKNTVPNDSYDSFLLNAANEVVVWCSYGKTHEESHGKAFAETAIGKGVDLTSHPENTKGRFETETHILELNPLPGYSGLKVVSAVDKQSISNASEGMIWQNYLLLMVGMLSQIVCFMMFNNSLRLSRILWSPEKDSLPLDALLKTHQDWQLKFRGAILEKEKVHALAIMDRDACTLGKWIAAKAGQLEHVPSFQELVEKHTIFHREAGTVVNLVNASDYDAALEAIAEGSAYAVASMELTEALLLLKKELAVLI